MTRTKTPENLTYAEIQWLVNDLHSLMWMGDGCEICAHKIVDKRGPYKRLRCKLGSCIDCHPLWRGFVEEGKA